MAGRRHLTEADLKARPRCWRPHELKPGEEITGHVLRLPTRGAFNASRLFLLTDTEIVGFPADARSGHSVLERELGRKGVKLGQKITVAHNGTHRTIDGKRSYRLEQVIC